MLARSLLFGLCVVGVAPCRGEEPSSPPPTKQPPPADPSPTPEQPGDPAQDAPSSPDPVAAGAEGAACQAPDDCNSGICEGEGCDAAAPGRCRPEQRMCTRDLVTYCDCQGEVFRASGSCPGRRYAHRGPCEGSEAGPVP